MTAIPSNFQEPHFGNIPIACVHPSKTNPRKHFDETALAELAESIKNHGVAQPILVRPLPTTEDMIDCVEIVAGERRYRASKLAGLETIPAIVRELTDVQALEIQVIENLQRQDVHPIEEAEGYDQLMKQHGYTADQLAEKVGKSRSYIYGRLKFAALAEKPRAAFFEGKLAASTALLIARIPTANLQEQAAEEIVANRTEPMSYREAANHIQQRYMLSLAVAPFSLTDAKLVSSAGSCEACPKRTGNQPLLFEDVKRADVCTDPDCYAVKRIAHGQKAIAQARKKKIPVYTREEAKEHEEELENLASENDHFWDFERRLGDATGFKKVGELLGVDQRPEPKAYIKHENGTVDQLFDKTAMQEALEKAGLCETLESHNKRIQEKLKQQDPAKAAEEERRQQEAKARAERRAAVAAKETAVRIATYRRVRTAMEFGFTAEVLRIVVRELLRDFSLPNKELPDVYPWEGYSDSAAQDFVAKADVDDLQLMIMDMVFSNALEVVPYHLNDDDTIDPEDDEALLLAGLAETVGVSIDEVRAEMEEVSDPVPEEDGEQPATSSKQNRSKSKKTEVVSKVEWPFPTEARGGA